MIAIDFGRFWRGVAVVLVGSCLAIQAKAATHAAPVTMAYWENEGSTASLMAASSEIRQLATDTWAVDATGGVSGEAPSAALGVAARQGIRTFATISNFDADGFDGAIAHALFQDPAAQRRMFQDLSVLIAKYGYDGINIDFEALEPADRGLFTKFMIACAGHLHALGKGVVLSMPAMLKDDPTDSWTGAYHLAALGHAVDTVQYMTYDESGPWGASGPVAGLDWVTAAVKYALGVMPAAKISLGVPAYGYDWNLTDGTGIQLPYRQIPALIANRRATPVWDAAAASPHFHYTRNGESHVVWYENRRSIELKAKLATSQHLAGVSMFALGYDNGDFWDALKLGGQ